VPHFSQEGASTFLLPVSLPVPELDEVPDEELDTNVDWLTDFEDLVCLTFMVLPRIISLNGNLCRREPQKANHYARPRRLSHNA
jgi:hypothetical protein